MTKTEILDLVEEEDVEFIRLQFTDIFGNLKNVAVTVNQLGKVLANRYAFEDSALYDDYMSGDEELYLYPDLDTFVLLPWRPQQGKVARLICDIHYADGTPCEMSPRNILKNVLNKAKEKGYEFYVDPECEFFLFHLDENGTPTTVTHEVAGYMDVGPIDLGENARRDMVLTLEKMGFEVESSYHEKAPAQHEIVFTGDDALVIADRVVTFRSAVRSIAKRFGLHATFMPKPRKGVAGSGLHMNISVYKEGRNIFNSDTDGVRVEANQFMGGIMAHAKAMCAITNPVVNSYKRINSGYDAPKKITWTRKNRNALIRLHVQPDEDTRVEIRFPDSAANPYLTLAVCILAGMEGIENDLSAGKAYTEIIEQELPIEKLPGTLREAITELERDTFMERALGKEFLSAYINMKKEEWAEYMAEISEWEVKKYLNRL